MLRPQEYQLRQEGGGLSSLHQPLEFFWFYFAVRAKSSSTLLLKWKAVKVKVLAHAVTSRARRTADVQLSRHQEANSPSCSLYTLPLR